MFGGRVGALGGVVPLVRSWDQAELPSKPQEPGILRAAELTLGTVPGPAVMKYCS